jgi:hypothetical protein
MPNGQKIRSTESNAASPTLTELNGSVTHTATPNGAVESWDLAALRLPQDFGASIGSKKLLTTVPVRRPTRQEYIRVHPDESWRLQTAVLTVEEDRESYLVAPTLWGDLASEARPTTLFTALNRQAVLFLWPVRLPGADGRLNPWHASALQAAELAMSAWIRLQANQGLVLLR